MTFIKHKIRAFDTPSDACYTEKFVWGSLTPLTIVVIPACAIGRGIVNATSIVTTSGCGAHVTDYTAT